jgi:cyclopropane fatty-acyl-phospholipid synthase-like methyltransferase
MFLHKKIYWRLLRLVGFETLSWDLQHKAGLWSKRQRSSITVDLINQLSRGGQIIEFGCGEGDLLYLLHAESYSYYTGIDISQIAIQRAKLKASKLGIINCEFVNDNMATWSGSKNISLILLEECIYYLNGQEMKEFIGRCLNSINDDGAMLVIVHSAEKHAASLDICRKCGRVISETNVGSRVYLILGKNISE